MTDQELEHVIGAYTSYGFRSTQLLAYIVGHARNRYMETLTAVSACGEAKKQIDALHPQGLDG